MTEITEVTQVDTTKNVDTSPLAEDPRILSADELIGAANVAEKMWGNEPSFIDTTQLEAQHTLLLINALLEGQITPEQFAEAVGKRMAEKVVAGEKDDITQLDNRAGGSKKTRKELARAARKPQTTTSMLFIDLDGFKDTNDLLGHLVGNQALYSAGQYIASNIREYDIPFRWGGDEFAVILPDTGVEEAVATVGARLLNGAPESIREQMEGMGHEIPKDITFSIGVAEDTPTEDHLDSDLDGREEILTGLADKAMLVSKFRGKNKITIGTVINDMEIFKDPITGEMFTGEFEIKSNGDRGKLLRLNPYVING